MLPDHVPHLMPWLHLTQRLLVLALSPQLSGLIRAVRSRSGTAAALRGLAPSLWNILFTFLWAAGALE